MISFNGSQFTAITIDIQGYLRAMNKRMLSAMREGALRFYKEAIKLVPSPGGPRKSEIATGFSSGAFKNILLAIRKQGGQSEGFFQNLVPGYLKSKVGSADELKQRKGDILEFNRVLQRLQQAARKGQVNSLYRLEKLRKLKNARQTISRKSLGKYRGVLKTPQSGKRFATPPDQILTKIGGGYRGTKATIQFKFALDIDYFNIEDVIKHHSSFSDWKAMRTGRAAFRTYITSKEFKKRAIPELKKYLQRVTFTITGNQINRVSRKTQRLSEGEDG